MTDFTGEIDTYAFGLVWREGLRWGIPLVSLPGLATRVEPKSILSPSQVRAVMLKDGTIVWDPDEQKVPCYLMHEISHAIMWRWLGHHPETVNELGAMMGLEYEAATRLNYLPKYEIFLKYVLCPNGVPVANLSDAEKGSLLGNATAAAQSAGLLTRGGFPTYGRSP